MIDLEAVAKKLDRRDGFRMVAYREVGIPVFRLNCGLTFQEISSVGPIEEFMVRAISQGVDSADHLERFLGLPSKIIASQLGQLVYEHLVSVRPDASGRYQLTPLGARHLDGASSSQIVRQQMPIYVDGITRKLIPVDPSELWSNKQLDEVGVSCITPTPSRAPKATDIDVGDINRVVGLMSKADRPNLRVIRFDAVIGRPSLVFRRAQALAFKALDGKRMSVGFAIDGRQSDEHEIEYERSGKARGTSIFGALFDPDKRRKEAQAVRRELRNDIELLDRHWADEKAARPMLRLAKGSDSQSVAAANVRVLSVYEHPPIMRNAFDSAQKRLLIVSPWIRANVVDSAFIKLLTSCLDRGVDITIAYGIGKKDPGEREIDRKARESLEALSKAFGNFRLVRKGNTHAKVLLVDSSFFVTTSFNWLSFRGDPNQPMREEEGTLVQDAEVVESYYQKLIARMPLAAE